MHRQNLFERRKAIIEITSTRPTTHLHACEHFVYAHFIDGSSGNKIVRGRNHTKSSSEHSRPATRSMRVPSGVYTRPMSELTYAESIISNPQEPGDRVIDIDKEPVNSGTNTVYT